VLDVVEENYIWSELKVFNKREQFVLGEANRKYMLKKRRDCDKEKS